MKCADCRHSFREPVTGPQILPVAERPLRCRRVPPVNHAFLVPAPGGGAQVMEHSSFPQVLPDWVCGHWLNKGTASG